MLSLLNPGVLWQWSSCSCRFCIFISEDTFGSAGKGMGMVKTTHKEYPLAYLKSWALGHENQQEESFVCWKQRLRMAYSFMFLAGLIES